MMTFKAFFRSACLLSVLAFHSVEAARYILPSADTPMVGWTERHTVRYTETLADIAREYGVGHDEIVAANPGVDVWLPGQGSKVLLPTRFILPGTVRRGIVVNLPEMRLYHYSEDTQGRIVVTTHPVSVGRMDWRTPLGASRVVSKVTDPKWYPPASIRAEHEEDGDPLPKVVPAGPDNPLGRHMLRLDIPGYLIHGTNRPYGVGMRVTHGCLRMYPEDIAWLYTEAGVGTPVELLNEPFKIARVGEKYFVEIHRPLEEEPEPAAETLKKILREIERQEGGLALTGIDKDQLLKQVQQASGVPQPVPILVLIHKEQESELKPDAELGLP